MIKHTYILDTNVYGELLIEKDSPKIIKGIKEDKTCYVYGLNIIEDELISTPINIKFKDNLLRDAVLAIYRLVISKELTLIPIAIYLASEYYKKYDELRKLGKYYGLISKKIKKYSEKDLKVDFQIIAMASLKCIDIVVSLDKRTILSGLAKDTYDMTNKLNGLRTPKLVGYSDFKKRYADE